MCAFFVKSVGRLRYYYYLCTMINWKNLFAAIAVSLISISSQAKEDVVPQVHRDIHHMLQAEMDESLAFRNVVDSISSTRGVEEVFDLFSTNDFYSVWSNNSVNPMLDLESKTIPNTYDIDLTGFHAPIEGSITSPYGWRRRRMHKGEDIGLHTGDTVRAAFDGRVRIKRYERRGYGYYYVIRHQNGLETIYGHLSRQLVQEGDIVRAGQAIGLGGSTGRSTGPHLHFEMRFYGIALDPSELIDFTTFKPKSPSYHFEKGRAEWAQNNKGKRGATYRGGSSSATTTASTNNKNSNKSSSSKNNASSGNIHRVKQGDTLSAIARRYGTTVSRLCKLNGIRADKTLQLGQKIRYK